MRVNYNFKDDFGQYDIVAEVSHTGRVSVLDIKDEYGTEILIEDFSDDEISQMGYLAKRAADELDRMPDEDDDDDN
jgi:hypothetical protein